jgi:hypothetical protein
MNAAGTVNRLARSLGIVAIFAFVGPLAVTAVFGLFISVIGIPVLRLVLAVLDLEMFHAWLSVALFLLLFLTFVAAVPPSIVTGVAFAIAAVYCGLNSLWAALVIMIAVVIGVVALGFVVSPPESSPLLLPEVKGLRQGAFLTLFLLVPAGIAAGLCWLFSRPLWRLA